MAKLQILIVTPEATALDQQADAVVLPLYDGQSGILPGHAAMIGRLGPGEVRVRDSGTESGFYVDGGFVQVEKDVVSIMAGGSKPVAELDSAEAATALETALALPSDTAVLADVKEKAVSQARAKVRITQPG